MRPIGAPRRAGAGVLALLLTAACTGTAFEPGDPNERALTILAAASLTEPFNALAAELESGHEDTVVLTSFDSSATLATQVAAGAPADVVATADPRTMQVMVDAGVLDGSPVPFAHNQLTLVVPAGNPAGIDSLADLESPEVDFVACVASAPCGALAAKLLEDHGVDAEPRSYDVDVKSVLSKVLLDEADAGLVYASDVVDGVSVVPLPGPPATTTYLAARVASSEQPDLAAAWFELLRSPTGRRVLADAGFTPSRGRP